VHAIAALLALEHACEEPSSKGVKPVGEFLWPDNTSLKACTDIKISSLVPFITERDLTQMGEEAAAWAAAGGDANTGGGVVSAISMETVGEALEVRRLRSDMWEHPGM
jgi:hypothetical protein